MNIILAILESTIRCPDSVVTIPASTTEAARKAGQSRPGARAAAGGGSAPAPARRCGPRSGESLDEGMVPTGCRGVCHELSAQCNTPAYAYGVVPSSKLTHCLPLPHFSSSSRDASSLPWSCSRARSAANGAGVPAARRNGGAPRRQASRRARASPRRRGRRPSRRAARGLVGHEGRQRKGLLLAPTDQEGAVGSAHG